MNYEDHCIGLGKLWGDLQGPANAGAKTNRKNISLWQKAMAQIALVGRAAQGLGMGDIAKAYEAQRFDLRLLRRFRADLSIRKLRPPSSPTALEARQAAQKAVRQPAFAGP